MNTISICVASGNIRGYKFHLSPILYYSLSIFYTRVLDFSKALAFAVKTKLKTRFPIIDRARGLAILLMFLSHSIDFFYSGEMFWMDFVRWFTATVSFTMFIYLSGASNYIASIEHAGASEVWQKKKLHMLLKTLHLLFVYYFLVVLLTFLKSQQLTITAFADVALLRTVPTYTEFILTFIILNFSLVLFGRAYKFILKNSFAVIVVGLNMYILGMFFYQIDFGESLNIYKALFVGHDQGYRFPVFQYFPIYLFGMKFGRELLTVKKRFRISWVIQLLLISSFVFIFAYTKLWQNVNGEGFIYLQRWPPSVSFLLVGLLFVQGVIILYKLWNFVFKSQKEKTTLLEFLGKNPLDFYVFHILLLESYDVFIGSKTSNVLLVFAGFSLLVLIVSIIVFVKKRSGIPFDLKVERKISAIINKRFSKTMKHIYRLIALSVLVGIGFLIFQKVDIAESNDLPIEEEGFIQGVSAPAQVEWWNKDYKYYSELTVYNKETDKLLDEGSVISVRLDHKQLVDDEKSLESGEDVTVVHLKDGVYRQLKVYLEDANTTDAKLYFEIVGSIAPDSSVGGYFLYYGNKHPVGVSVLEIFSETTRNYEIEIAEEQSSVILTALSRQWYLKDYSKVGPQDTSVVYKIQMTASEPLEDQDIVVNLKGNREQQFAPSKLEERIFELKIPLDILDPGEYEIQTTVKGKNYESDILTFNVSYPLFVTWTIDWEGYDVSEENLKAIRDISSNSEVPLTTFFNPRIFIASEIPDHRKTRMVQWALDGEKTYGDEIGLHLHMHQDMIAAAGLEPKSDPRWGGRENGHDVLTTAYEYEEFETLVNWALQMFRDNGLPRPDSYRAGGWFMDEVNLQVLDDLGFKIDSSGREPIVYGPNEIENPWKLSSTTKPYQPSVDDQNSSRLPTLDLWEFPNNGMDSTNRNFDVMIEKFYDNYNGGPLDSTQVLTYLSHPHWFTQLDKDDMVKSFEIIDKYKYSEDAGAVVYTTLIGAHDEIARF